ncbi:kinase-like domain-containing protein [Protomyces lactucae-debilis]|uniref:non-specific serine/threonine protein kinase n=1 Tax=Protomyces lactucae-debilis TaxID=2754530 RepID=A0A1Y2FDW3_PROLT|nr:kinase-like domain-containing protein [Protomyces lactucae-debilis]ORY82109.1 kinase-like domain-containing protein [Protomyces lactucae-debilis]
MSDPDRPVLRRVHSARPTGNNDLTRPSGLGRIRVSATRQNSREWIPGSGAHSPQIPLIHAQQPVGGGLSAGAQIMHHQNISTTHLEDLETFPNTSLHAFSFAVQHDTIAARHNIVKRSLDYLRDKFGSKQEQVAEEERPAKVKKPTFALDLEGVNDGMLDPSRQGPKTAPLTFISPPTFSTESSEASTAEGSPDVSRSTTRTSTSNQSTMPPRRRSSFVERQEVRLALHSSLSCTNLPSLNTAYQQSPLMPVHPTNRWGQQATQAVFTTTLEAPWSIQSANDYAMMIFGMGRDAIRKRTSLLDYVVEDRREWLREKLQSGANEDKVLLCGDVLPVIKRLGTGAASLWIKEKQLGLVWVIEEIEEGVVELQLDSEDDKVLQVHGDTVKIFERDVQGEFLSAILPTLPRDSAGRLEMQQIKERMHFTLKSSASVAPCTVEPSVFSTDERHKLRVSFLPHVAGIIIVGAQHLDVKSANGAFTSSLFGYKETAGFHISRLIPHFELLLRQLEEHNGGEFAEGTIVPELAFREAGIYLTRPEDRHVLQGIQSLHCDGCVLPIDIQMRVAQQSDGEGGLLYALWVSYERAFTVSRDMQTLPATKRVASETSSPAESGGDEIVPRRIGEYTILEEMGAGAYGQVKLARYGRKRQRVVLKYVTKSRILVDTWTRDRRLGTVPLEIHVLNHLKQHPHRNLVEMKDFFEDDENYYIAMTAHSPGMDLFDYIELNTDMREIECISISLQVARALAHLHALDIVHRDIKDENVVLDRNGWVKLIDFGSANYCRNGPFDTFHGTIDYASPEALEGKPYNGKEQDVWACGILFYTLIYKENPFYNIDEIMDRDLRVPYIISDRSIDLVRRMLNRDVPSRLTMEDVLQHAWYEGFEGDAIQQPVRIPGEMK